MLSTGLTWREVAVLRALPPLPASVRVRLPCRLRRRRPRRACRGDARPARPLRRDVRPRPRRRGSSPPRRPSPRRGGGQGPQPDADRVVSALRSLVHATLRTNAYVTRDYSPGVRRALAIKLATQQIPLALRRGRDSRCSCTHPGWRVCICASVSSRAVGCAGRTGPRTIAPRFWAW